VAVCQRDVRYDDVGVQLPVEPHGFCQSPRLAAHLQVALATDHSRQTLPDDRMVVDDQDAIPGRSALAIAFHSELLEAEALICNEGCTAFCRRCQTCSDIEEGSDAKRVPCACRNFRSGDHRDEFTEKPWRTRVMPRPASDGSPQLPIGRRPLVDDLLP